MKEARIAKPAFAEWPLVNGVRVIDEEELLSSWEKRTGAANIRERWRRVGVRDVLDVPWLREHVHEFEDDAVISLFVDLCCFAGDDDLSVQLDIVTPIVGDQWAASEREVTR